MKIFFSILLNASILFIISFLLNTNTYPDAVIVLPSGVDSWKTYLLWGIILGVLNIFIRPILKFIWLPFFFIFPIVTFLINAILLWMLSKTINNIIAPLWWDMTFEINGAINFIIAVAIFSILNIVYGVLFSKK